MGQFKFVINSLPKDDYTTLKTFKDKWGLDWWRSTILCIRVTKWVLEHLDAVSSAAVQTILDETRKI